MFPNNNYQYYYNEPIYNIRKPGLLSKIKNTNFSSFLNNASQTLNLINQVIPVVKQVGPLINNARTMLKIANIMKTDDTKKTNFNKQNNKINTNKQIKEDNSNQPTFFI